jgi:hypothetical protein
VHISGLERSIAKLQASFSVGAWSRSAWPGPAVAGRCNSPAGSLSWIYSDFTYLGQRTIRQANRYLVSSAQ